MNCRHARQEMVPYLDGEPTDGSPLQAHLERCQACRRELGELRRSFAEIVLPAREREPRVTPSPHLLTRLNRRLEEAERYGCWLDLARALRWLCGRERLVLAAWGLALLLLCAHLNSYVQVETVALHTSDPGLLRETHIDLRLGELLQVTLVRFVG